MNFNNNLPIYLQVLELIQRQIIQKEYDLGEKLPSVRELATIYRVNPNTIQRSLQILEEDKLIITDRTNGKFVTEDLNLILEVKEKLAHDIMCAYMEAMHHLGFTDKEAIQYIKQTGKECE